MIEISLLDKLELKWNFLSCRVRVTGWLSKGWITLFGIPEIIRHLLYHSKFFKSYPDLHICASTLHVVQWNKLGWFTVLIEMLCDWALKVLFRSKFMCFQLYSVEIWGMKGKSWDEFNNCTQRISLNSLYFTWICPRHIPQISFTYVRIFSLTCL